MPKYYTGSTIAVELTLENQTLPETTIAEIRCKNPGKKIISLTTERIQNTCKAFFTPLVPGTYSFFIYATLPDSHIIISEPIFEIVLDQGNI